MCIGSHQAEGRNTTFIMGHALLKKAILHLKRANGRFILQGTVAVGPNSIHEFMSNLQPLKIVDPSEATQETGRGETEFILVHPAILPLILP